MFLSATVTASASLFSLMPPQSLQGVNCIKLSYSCFMVSEPVSRYLLSTFLIRPSKATGYTPLPLCPS